MSDVDYYQRREREELDAAVAAADPENRAIHEKLARKYAQLARQEPGRPMMASQV